LSQNPWKTYFTSLEVLKSVQQDVERTFPDIPFFRLPHVQKELTTVLFIHAQQNREIGYRQGMHEIAACLYMAIEFDSLDPSEERRFEEAEEFCSRNHIAADTSFLLSILLASNSQLGKWFEWREPPLKSPIVSGPTIPYVVPIVQTCNYLQNILLKAIDPALYESLKETGIEPTIYGM
jgi:TBC1 domain family member 5